VLRTTGMALAWFKSFKLSGITYIGKVAISWQPGFPILSLYEVFLLNSLEGKDKSTGYNCFHLASTSTSALVEILAVSSKVIVLNNFVHNSIS